MTTVLFDIEVWIRSIVALACPNPAFYVRKDLLPSGSEQILGERKREQNRQLAFDHQELLIREICAHC
jgi:hypothetical protein